MSDWVRRTNAEDGSAVAEFVMVSALLLLLSFSIIQLALIIHVRNTLIDAASNGAHFGALANREVVDTRQRTANLIANSLHSGFATDISVEQQSLAGETLVVVTVHSQAPLLGLVPNGWEITAKGQAVRYE
ncbi:hypothetical protein GCM10027417_23890 [Glutamicibacter endophyticus]